MFYNNNPISTFIDSFFDKGDVGVKQLDPSSQFSAAKSSVKEFNRFYKESVCAQILERIAGTIDTRAALFARLRNFKDDPLAITMVDIFIEDGFSQSSNKDFYEITYSPINNSAESEDTESEDEEAKAKREEEIKVIQDEINKTEKKFLLKSKFKNILFDLFLLGEWMWETEYSKTMNPETGGLISIKDNKLVDNIIGIYEDEVVSSYVELTQSSLGQINSGIREIDKDSILHLVLNPGTIRFYINDQFGLAGSGGMYGRSSSYVSGWNSNFSNFNSQNSIDDPANNYRQPLDQPAKGAKMLSKYIRTGRSVLYSSLKTLEKLALLDMTNLALLLKRALSPTIMNVQVPESFSYKKALEAASAYEQWFYDSTEETRDTFSQTGVDNLNFNRILELSQKFKCMPVWGDSKGALQTLDLADTRDNREAIQDIKDELSLTSGIPYYYFNPQAGGMEKKEMLKTYAKYARKLHILQQSVANPVIELHYNNLRYKGYKVNREDLAVKFKAIVNADSLESIEEIINLFTALSEIVQALDQFAASQALHIRVVTKAFMKYFRFITQSYPFIQDMLEEAPEQVLTDNPDLLAGNIGPGMMNYNMNPEDIAAMNQNMVDPATGQPLQLPGPVEPTEYQEAVELFGTTDLHEGMNRFKYQLAKKMSTKVESLDEAVINKPYRYSASSY